MPVYKALILNKQININYDHNQKKELEEAIKEINFKLKNYDQSAKISDTKLLSFLAIKLQAEILTHQKSKHENITFLRILSIFERLWSFPTHRADTIH